MKFLVLYQFSCLFFPNEAIEGVRHLVNHSIQFYAFDFGIDNRGAIPIGNINFDILLSTSPSNSVPVSRGLDFADKMLYIYTSGTTGLPKAVYSFYFIFE